MSTVKFLERDGQRIELAEGERLGSELRCDGCDDPITAGDLATADILINLSPQAPPNHEHTFHVDAHRSHLGAAIARVTEPLDLA